MKLIKIMVAVGFLMTMPFQVFAEEDEVTIRVMEMNENNERAVLHVIQLPEVASENAVENGQQGLREQEKNRIRTKEELENHHENTNEEKREEMMNDSENNRRDIDQIIENREENMDVQPDPGRQGPGF